jgi:hypothetical protein
VLLKQRLQQQQRLMQNKFNLCFKNPSILRGVFCLCLCVFWHCGLSQGELKFSEVKKNFGFIKKGELVILNFKFINSGNMPVLISEARAECSCTSVEYPREPILPGQSSVIVVKFDTKSTYDRQDRIVEIQSNAKKSNQKLRFKGVVLK